MIREDKKDLFIIIGGGGGLGTELHSCAVNENNACLVVNREAASHMRKNTKELLIDLSTLLTEGDLENIMDFSCNDYNSVNLICNAGVVEPVKPFGKIKNKDIISSVNINFLNHAIIINNFILKISFFRNCRAKIMVITSGAADSPHHGLGVYTGTKAGLEVLTRSIFIEQQLLKQVKVIAVRPGVMDTAMQDTMRNSSVDDFAKAAEYKKLWSGKKLLSPKKIAEVLLDIFKKPHYWRKPVLDIYEVEELV